MTEVRRFDTIERVVRDTRRKVADVESTVLARLGTHTHPGMGGGGVTDHGALTGLGDDDHPQYLNVARGDARYYTETETDSLLAGKESAGAASAAVAAHAAAADPHPGYLTPAEGNAAYQPLDSDLTTIAGLTPADGALMRRVAGAWSTSTLAQVKTDLALTKADVGLGSVDNVSAANLRDRTTHTGAQAQSTVTNLVSDLAGKAPTSHTHVATTDLTATGAKDSTTFLRGDNTWAVPPAGGGGGVTDHGALTGLADDDHTQYLTQARGDARYYTEAESDSLLAGKSSTGHAHDAGAIASGTFSIARLPTGTAASTVATGDRGLPAGGADGQVLTKTSSANYAVAWEALPSAGSTPSAARFYNSSGINSHTSTTYSALSSNSPVLTITVGATGILIVYMDSSEGGGTGGGHMSFALSGANTLAPIDWERSLFMSSGGPRPSTFSKTVVVIGLNAGSTTVSAMFRATSGTASWSRPVLQAVAL